MLYLYLYSYSIYFIFLPVFRFQWHELVVSMFVVFLRLCRNKSSHASLCREYFCQIVAIKLGMPFFKSTKQGPLIPFVLGWWWHGRQTFNLSCNKKQSNLLILREHDNSNNKINTYIVTEWSGNKKSTSKTGVLLLIFPYFTYPSHILYSLIQTLQALVCTSSSFPCTISISDWLMASHSYRCVFETWKIPGHLASWTKFLAHWGRTH